MRVRSPRSPQVSSGEPVAKRARLHGDGEGEEDGQEELFFPVSAEQAEQVLGGRSSLAQDKALWVAQEIGLEVWRVAGATQLFEEGNTLPFIARYRKEKTGSLDEKQLRLVERGLERADVLETRRNCVAVSLHKLGALTDERRATLLGAAAVEEVEDLWAPFKCKRQTRAQSALDKGLGPLATIIEARGADEPDVLPQAMAARFTCDDGAQTVEAALAGARDIVAGNVASRPAVKQLGRQVLERHVSFTAKVRSQDADPNEKYRTYWDFCRPMSQVKPYQFLAVQRGVSEKCLTCGTSIPSHVSQAFIKDVADQGAKGQARAASPLWESELWHAIEDGYRRLLLPSLEREWHRRLKERAEDDAFDTFRKNLRTKLLLPPLRMHPYWGEVGGQRPVSGVLGIDPAFRTGCKMALISTTGQVLATKTVFPHASVGGRFAKEAGDGLRQLLGQAMGSGPGKVVCSIGNGTASRETEAWLRSELSGSSEENNVAYTIVDEAGASVYSASPLAGEELPDLDCTMRGAVSIARRLLDPLSELVKISPQSIGVGLYQHDVNQKRLAKELKGGTEDCVNAVGVDLNTASPSLLGHVSGLSTGLAAAIVAHREVHGPFRTRKALLSVKGLGPKTFHQAAGFLRVHGGSELLDALPIHPESYKVAKAIQNRFGVQPEQWSQQLTEGVLVESMAVQLGTGLETLRDIAAALAGTAVDPRTEQPHARMKVAAARGPGHEGGAIDAQEVGLAVENLRPGMFLEGIVRNVVAFGSFVDVGVGHDGLLHVSQYPQGRDGLHVNNRVEVWVTSTQMRPGKGGKAAWRIALSMRGNPVGG